jgi:uncharacterized protein YdbL (DUF1318 family)
MKKLGLKFLLAVGLLFSSAQAATLVDATDPDQIVNIASGFGSAILEKDSAGDPKIVGRIDSIRYSIYFYGCSNNKNCRDIQFSAGWSGYNVSLNDINRWNAKKRYGRAYLDSDNDPRVEMTINTYKGVTYRNLEDSFDTWQKC